MYPTKDPLGNDLDSCPFDWLAARPIQAERIRHTIRSDPDHGAPVQKVRRTSRVSTDTRLRARPNAWVAATKEGGGGPETNATREVRSVTIDEEPSRPAGREPALFRGTPGLTETDAPLASANPHAP